MNHRDTEAQSSENFGVTEKVIGACIEVHRHLGPGLLESIYEECVSDELSDRGLTFERQVPLPIVYKGRLLSTCYRLDFVVENNVILELKSVDRLDPVHAAQVLTYLKLTRCRIGLLINFNVPVLKYGIRRLII